MSKKEFVTDSLRIIKPKLIRPQFRFDNRIAFFEKQRITIAGLDVGILVKNKFRIALGYYQMDNQLESITKTIGTETYSGQYLLKYLALNTEFIYLNKRYFSLGMPLEFGVGTNSLKYKSMVSDAFTRTERANVAMSYFGLSGTFKPIRWIGLKTAVGYRKTLFNGLSNLKVDGFYTSVGITVDFREIITDYKMYRLKRRYKPKSNSIETAVDLITD